MHPLFVDLLEEDKYDPGNDQHKVDQKNTDEIKFYRPFQEGEIIIVIQIIDKGAAQNSKGKEINQRRRFNNPDLIFFFREELDNSEGEPDKNKPQGAVKNKKIHEKNKEIFAVDADMGV